MDSVGAGNAVRKVAIGVSGNEGLQSKEKWNREKETDSALDSHLFKSSQENLIDVSRGKRMLGCVWGGYCGENFPPLLLQRATKGHLRPALSLRLKNKCTQARTIWGPSFHFSFIPDCRKAFIILAGIFPFLFSFLLGPQVKWWLRVLSVLLGSCSTPWRGTERMLRPGQSCSQRFWAAMQEPGPSWGFRGLFPSLPLWAEKPPLYRRRGKNKRFPLLFTASWFVIPFQPGSAISPLRFKPSLLHHSSGIMGQLCNFFVPVSLWKNG